MFESDFTRDGHGYCDIARRQTAIKKLRADVVPRLAVLVDEAKIPAGISARLRDWIAAVARDDQPNFAAEDRLLEAFGNLSVLYLAAHAYEGVSGRNRISSGQPDLILAPLTGADPAVAREAQTLIAGILIGALGAPDKARLASVFKQEQRNFFGNLPDDHRRTTLNLSPWPPAEGFSVGGRPPPISVRTTK